ncbi:acylphosphatase [Longispora fulva]|uniref:Acylphosphatase n=1 Tax=Longispora fulva TaxID=619741 RepID=A0A8J7GJH6_9ACTN|nr:acylphosphatase [Longispora fulva]MBG6138685.1 acylphosphatase [Longispora fulva]GIG58178.1 acylphosphatase [Longispora fulva]
MIRRRVIVSGRVQGVFFRGATQTAAEQRGVAGWVRNLPDGTVEAVFEGPPEAVGSMVAWVGHGPADARVTGVDVVEEVPDGESGFAVRG